MLVPLLKSGFFPQELPPLFSTASYADYVKRNRKSLPSNFTMEKAEWSSATHHNLVRVGGLRRRLSVPNPVGYFRLANAFDRNATVLQAKWNESTFSHTKPNLHSAGYRALTPPNHDRATPRALARVGSNYLLRADIAQFYPSIYTHTIPWALHSKEEAKANIKNKALGGNVLDIELQACQNGQTKGIAIGPDTSLGIAELLLSRIDTRLKEDCNIKGGVRFIDDMEFCFQKLADAEAALARLEALLYEYELQLNSNKTSIVELPDVVESPYVTQIRVCIPKSDEAPRSQWIDYFNTAFILAKEFPRDGVLRYAISALQNIRVKTELWELVQSLLWQSISHDPGCIRFVIDVLWLNIHYDESLKLSKPMAKGALNSMIESSAPVGHGSEVVWSIWAALLLKLKLSSQSQKAIATMEDSFVAVAAFVAKAHGVFASEFTSNTWEDWIEEGCFNGPHWLFAYESYRRDWMKGKVKNAKLNGDLCCKFFKQGDVSFIDEDIISSYRPKRTRTPIHGLGGGY